jgi:hypothetical protein
MPTLRRTQAALPCKLKRVDPRLALHVHSTDDEGLATRTSGKPPEHEIGAAMRPRDDDSSPQAGLNKAQSTAATDADLGMESGRLCTVSAKVAPSLRREIDNYAHAHGITRSRAVGEYLWIAHETLAERDGIPASRADDIMEVLEGLRVIVELLGPPSLGMLRLLAHWATRTGGLKVAEDELLAEVRTVGADDWEQAVVDAERELRALRSAVESELKP